MISALHLIPVGLGDSAPSLWMPPEVQQLAQKLTVYIAENAKTARAFLKTIGTPHTIANIQIYTLDHRTTNQEIIQWLTQHTEPVGLVSEAGCPAVADPGARVVEQAHTLNIPVFPSVGPSSILLGLMGSGLNGQKFTFQGYPPSEPSARIKTLEIWEKHSQQQHCTQIFIETPYRNKAVFDSCLETLSNQTQLCVARSLTTADQWIQTHTIEKWKKHPAPDLQKHPTLFLFLGEKLARTKK